MGRRLRGDLQHLVVAEAGAPPVQPLALTLARESAGQRGEVELDALGGHVDGAVLAVVLVDLPLEPAQLLRGDRVQLADEHLGAVVAVHEGRLQEGGLVLGHGAAVPAPSPVAAVAAITAVAAMTAVTLVLLPRVVQDESSEDCGLGIDLCQILV